MGFNSAGLTSKRGHCHLDNQTARRLLLDRYGLLPPQGRQWRRDELQALIEKLGYVQIDSIRRIERAHHMILHARIPAYRQNDLWNLAEKKRQLFETWTHDACLVPMQFYRYWQPRFRRSREALLKRWRLWRQPGFEQRFEAILQHIQTHGPVKARDLAPQKPKGSGASSQGWWDWHPDKSALEFLWRTGELAVTRRENFQKVYDLSEHVVPDCERLHAIDEEQMTSWLCEQALLRLGFGSAGEIAGFWDTLSAAEVSAWIARQPASRIIEVEVEGAAGTRPQKAYALSEALETMRETLAERRPSRGITIINPFDPLIRNRRRMTHIFGFDYRIEVFTPEAKRQYGYYVCPILQGSQLVGRIDMRHVRETNQLFVSKIWWEPNLQQTKNRTQKLEQTLHKMATFIGADGLTAADGSGLLTNI